MNVVDEVNPDETKRSLRKQVPSKILVGYAIVPFEPFHSFAAVSIKVSNLKFILKRLLKIELKQDISLEIVSKVCYNQNIQI